MNPGPTRASNKKLVPSSTKVRIYIFYAIDREVSNLLLRLLCYRWLVLLKRESARIGQSGRASCIIGVTSRAFIIHITNTPCNDAGVQEIYDMTIDIKHGSPQFPT